MIVSSTYTNNNLKDVHNRFQPMKCTVSIFTLVVLLIMTKVKIKGEGKSENDIKPPCPETCRCSHIYFPSIQDHPMLTVNCSYENLVRLPTNIPHTTQALILSNNLFRNLTRLPKLLQLRFFDVSKNRISFLGNNWVFEHVCLLKVLDVHGNRLRNLQRRYMVVE